MRPDASSLRTAVTTVGPLLVAGIAWTASVLGTAANWLRRLLARTWRTARSLVATGRSRTRRFLAGPVRRTVTGPVRTVLLGRRSDLSLLAALVAPILALGSAWWVGSTFGYATLEAWVRGTWHGTNPSLVVFLGVAALVGLGAVSAARNSGLLPTTLLVSAPIFGAAVTRYGTEASYTWGTSVVSLPEAVGVALAFAVAFGVPIAVCGFLVGAAIRRVLAVFGSRSGPPSSPDGA